MSAPGVLLVAANLTGGGAERQLVEMANFWIARDLAVSVATWDDAETKDFYRLDSRVRRIRLGANSRSGSFAVLRSVVARIRALRSELLASGPNVIVSFLTENNVLTLLAATRTRCPVIVSERTHPGHDDTVTSLVVLRFASS